ncbi:MAG: hypothetical protein Q4P84_08015 [Elusimicrobiales bacterium]|nr:hypothetical protein [Elusimicrobiales bacterium]
MKKFKATLYWIGTLLAYIAAFGLLSFIVGMAIGVPDTMFGGIVAYGLIICGLVFGATDETRNVIKRLILRKEFDDE